MENKETRKIIHCISGLGADGEIFKGFYNKSILMQYTPWIEPFKNESLRGYAKRMSDTIKDPEPVILGVSFGGMLAIEIAKLRRVNRLILVSVAKTRQELPFWMKFSGTLNLHKILPVQSIRLTEKMDNRRLGISNKEEEQIVAAYRKSGSSNMLNWGVDKVLKWKNNTLPARYIHIHGSDDKVFPIRKIKATHIIDGGTHIMMLNRKKEIDEILGSLQI